MILDFDKSSVLLSSEGTGNSSVFHQAMFQLSDAPAGYGSPRVGYDLKIEVEKDTVDVLVYLLIYTEAERIGKVGQNVPGLGLTYCCIAAGGCAHNTKVGDFIVWTGGSSLGFTMQKVLVKSGSTVSVTGQLGVNSTDVYYIQATTCKKGGTFTLTGTATWENPFGYLPGDVFSKLPFAGVMALMDLTIFTFFGVLMIKFRKTLIKLQWCTLGVALISSICFTAWFFYRVHNNGEGHYHLSSLVFVVLLDTFKHTTFRVLVLLLAMGYGVVKWTLGHIVMVKLVVLSVSYLVFSFVFLLLNEISDLGTYKQVDNWAKLAVLVPRAFLETSFFYWIMLSLIRTIQQLILRKQQLKLNVYKTFFGVLVGIILVTVVILLYLAITKPSWKNKWLVDGVWDLLFFIVLLSIALLWRPRKNNTLYGAESLTRVDDDRVINTHEDDVAIPITEEFVFQGAKRRNRAQNDDSPQKEGKKTSDREDYDNSREKTIVATGFNPEEHSTFTQSILEFEIEEEDHQGVLDEISKLS